METIRIEDAPHFVGQKVRLGAWLRNKRGSNKMQFLQLRDGTGFFQGVVAKEAVGEDIFAKVKALTQETSMYLVGTIRQDDRSDFGYEMDVEDVTVVGESEGYPITPKEHGTDFLMDHRHLYLRHIQPFAVLRIRNTLIAATYEFFNK